MKQTQTFDVEYVDDNLWETLKPRLEECVTSASPSILDIGGGNGVFVDRIIEYFDNVEAVLIEPATNLYKKINHIVAKR